LPRRGGAITRAPGEPVMSLQCPPSSPDLHTHPILCPPGPHGPGLLPTVPSYPRDLTSPKPHILPRLGGIIELPQDYAGYITRTNGCLYDQRYLLRPKDRTFPSTVFSPPFISHVPPCPPRPDISQANMVSIDRPQCAYHSNILLRPMQTYSQLGTCCCAAKTTPPVPPHPTLGPRMCRGRYASMGHDPSHAEAGGAYGMWTLQPRGWPA
jgi:hypothetical protein